MKRILALAVVLLAVVAAVAMWHPWRSELPDDAVFAIGDDVVSVADLDERDDSLRALYGVQEPLDGARRDTFRRQAAKSMAISMVLDRAVDEAGIDVPDADVDKAMDAFVASQFSGAREDFLDALGNVGTSEAAVRTEIRRQLELRLLLDDVAGEVEVSDDELAAAFAERKDRLSTPQKRGVSNIVVATRNDARSARRRLDGGYEVGALARELSIDGATRDRGGWLGAVAQADLVPAVGAAVFGVPAGSAYGPVLGPQGWNVGVVSRVIPAAPATLRSVGEQLRASLVAEEKQRRWSAWLADELRGAAIEYADEYRPDEPYDVTAWQNADLTGPTPEPRS